MLTQIIGNYHIVEMNASLLLIPFIPIIFIFPYIFLYMYCSFCIIGKKI
ncbi:MAG: hypothetical protein JWN78_3066 [Bacteroidota bacterium]|nr:hypothetical protein [Bacteroidota bacterium]